MRQQSSLFDKQVLRLRRSRAAKTLMHHDFLLERVASDFAERLVVICRDFEMGAVIGAHTGRIAHHLRSLENVGDMLQTESDKWLARQLDGDRVVCDEELLPFADGSFDLIVSGLTLQLANDLPGALVQMARALRPDGLLMVALLGGETLWELRDAFVAAELEVKGGVTPRVAPFADIRELGSLLHRAGLALPVADRNVVTVTYSSPIALMHELRMMGATNVLHDRDKKWLNRATLERVLEIYSNKFSEESDRIRATFEIVTLTAWAPDSSQPKPLRPGSARARLADALGTKEHSAREKAGRKSDR